MIRTPQHPSRSTAEIELTLREQLAQRLLSGGIIVEGMHLILAALVLVLVWDEASWAQDLVWLSIVAVVALVRAFVRGRLESSGATVRRTLTVMRAAVIANGLAWGIGALLAAPRLPDEDMALVLVVLSGLTAASTITLVADAPAFLGFLFAMLGPVSLHLAEGENRWHTVALILVGLYTATMVVLHRRAHRTLVGELTGSLLLSESKDEVVRDRSFLDALIRSAPSAIVAVDFHSQAQRVNRGFEQLFGYTAAEVAGRTIDDLIVPESERTAIAELRRRAATGEAVRAEGVRRHKDGHLIDVAISAARTEGIDPGGFFVMYDDITERKRADALLQSLTADLASQKAHLLAQSEASPAGILVVDAAGKKIHYNELFVQLWRLPPAIAQLADDGPTLAWVLDQVVDPDAFVARVRYLYEHVTEKSTEEIALKDGRTFERFSAPVLGAQGRYDGRIWHFRDVTRRKQAEVALVASEERFRELADNMQEVFHVSTPGAREHLYISPAFDTVWGFSREILKTNPSAFIEAVNPEDVPVLVAAMQSAERGEDSGKIQYRIRLPDGRERWIEDHTIGIRDATGQVTRVSGIARDVTALKAASVAERNAREAAEQATRAKTSFLANMSHEIRTPMSGILGTVELLRDTALTPDQQRSLEVISDSGDALLRIINDILDLTKIEAGQFALENIPFDLPKTLDATMHLLAARAFERGLELVSDFDPQLPRMARGDAGRLRQVLINVVGNALKFTHEGEVVLSVKQLRRVDGTVEIECSVRDTGIGMAPDQMHKLFEPFHQGDVSTTRRYGGTGLGLSISRKLVRLMGGEITVTSELGLGSTFTFRITLPVERETAVAGAPRLGELRDVRTLLVDDNATNRNLLVHVLAQAGADVDQAASADGAFTAMQKARDEKRPYGLVVSDVRMPDRDGFDLARSIRGDSSLGDVRIMLLTSGGQQGDGERCRQLDVRAYLHKPVSPSDLLQSAHSVMGSSSMDAAPPLITRYSIEEARRSLRILLAEDNPVNQAVAAAMLRKRGHRVTIAENGRKAVDAVREETFDAVLMDMQMPVLDGLGATREIRQFLDGRPLPIIALTANVLAGERELCLAAGMNDYLGKPFKAHDLFAVLEGWNPPADADTAPVTVGSAPEAVPR